MAQKILVTGAGGLMGQYVVNELRPHAEICGLDVLEAAGDNEHIVGDVEDADAVTAACEGCDAVVHIAARPNIWSGSGSEIIRTNTVGTWNVLDGAERAGVKRVVITSSDSVLGFTVLEGAMIPPDHLPAGPEHPLRATDPYALSKVLGERMAESFVARGQLEVLAIRPVYVLYPEFECEVFARAKDLKTTGGQLLADANQRAVASCGSTSIRAISRVHSASHWKSTSEDSKRF